MFLPQKTSEIKGEDPHCGTEDTWQGNSTPNVHLLIVSNLLTAILYQTKAASSHSPSLHPQLFWAMTLLD